MPLSLSIQWRNTIDIDFNKEAELFILFHWNPLHCWCTPVTVMFYSGRKESPVWCKSESERDGKTERKMTRIALAFSSIRFEAAHIKDFVLKSISDLTSLPTDRYFGHSLFGWQQSEAASHCFSSSSSLSSNKKSFFSSSCCSVSLPPLLLSGAYSIVSSGVRSSPAHRSRLAPGQIQLLCRWTLALALWPLGEQSSSASLAVFASLAAASVCAIVVFSP